MVTAISKEGIQRMLIYNESVLTVDRSDVLSFHVVDKNIPVEFTINFSFKDDGEQFTSSLNVSPDGKIIDLILFNWNSTNFVETTEPMILPTNGINLWVKFRNGSYPGRTYRTFQL